MHELIDQLFEENTLAHIRRAQGLIREARKEVHTLGKPKAQEAIAKAIQTMKSYNNIRVAFFRESLNHSRKLLATSQDKGNIQRKAGNPMLRYTHTFSLTH